MAVQTEPERLREQRLSLPDQPGVYVFRDKRGRVIYVGKAKSIRKRVASHFSNPTVYGTTALTEEIDDIQALVVVTEAEALLTEQNFIKQYKPRFNIRLRDDKSYPYIAISLDEDFPRVYFTRERHKRERVYFGPYSSAKRVRGTLDLLGKIFLFRSCEGTEPGRHSGSPCLDYYIKRCGAPCVGYVSRAEYREGIDGVVAFLSGRFKQIEKDLERKMYFAAGERNYEQATLERNRLQAVKALLERQRVSEGGAGTYDAVAVALEATEANAQVFQVRDGVLSDRQSFYLENHAEQDAAIVIEEFILQYYSAALSIPALIVVQGVMTEGSEKEVLGEILAERRGGPVEIRTSERGGKRRILDLAERNARLALDQEKLKAERRRQQRVDSVNGLQAALAMDNLPMRIECFDISHVGGTHTVASMVVFEGGAPKKSDYRRFTIREVEGNDDFASMAEVLTRRYAQWEKQNGKSPYDADRDASFAALPNLVVIDGGKGQLSAGLEPLQGFRDRGVTVVSLAKRIEEVFTPGAPNPIVLPHDTPELQLLQRVRDEAHRFAITHHRSRRDKAMTESIMDDLPGVGPARKRALLKHFGSPEAVLGASREALENVPGFPQKVARDLYAHLNKTGRCDVANAVRDTDGQRSTSNLEDLVVISGLSGAGKSSAMNVFEDAGYFCVDNLPAEMIRSLSELFMHAGSKVERAAVVCDSRGGEYAAGMAGVIDQLAGAGVVHRVVFLTADEEALVNRYKETRRRHPLAPHGSVVDGIRAEIALLAPVRERADIVIDTSGLSAAALRRKVADELLEPSTPGRLAVTFTSFGHKHGPPRDADLAFDVRFLPNPHYDPNLRPLTGFDQRIVDYVGRDGRLEEFYGLVIPLLEFLLPNYVLEGKAHLMVAIGCTGGRHRSVAITEHLGALFRDRPEYFVEIAHRDVDRLPIKR